MYAMSLKAGRYPVFSRSSLCVLRGFPVSFYFLPRTLSVGKEDKSLLLRFEMVRRFQMAGFAAKPHAKKPFQHI